MRRFAWIKARREALRLTQQELAAASGLSLATIQELENPESTRKFNRSTLILLAQGLKIPAKSLLDGRLDEMSAEAESGKPPASAGVAGMVHIPAINKVSASRFEESTDLGYPERVAAGTFAIPESLWSDPQMFTVEIEGDCMAPRYQAGEWIVCSPNSKFVDGAAYMVQLDGSGDGENGVKLVFDHGPNEFELVPLNGLYRRKMVPKSSVIRMGRVLYKICPV